MRAWVKVVLVFCLFVALAAAGPLWLGPVLRVAGRPLHLRFRSYRAVSYTQFELQDAVYRHGPVTVTVGWARVDTPLLWLWRHYHGRDVRVRASDWHVLVVRSTTPPSGKPVGLAILHDQLVKLAGRLSRWLPYAHVENGRVDWPTGGFSLKAADWDVGTLRAQGLKWSLGSADVTAKFAAKGVVVVDANEADRQWRAALQWTGPAAGGKAWAWNQPMQIQAQYGPQGWLPVHGEIHAGGWSVPNPQARIGAWYPALSGSGDVLWENGNFQISVHAKAASKSPKAPPLDIDVAANGNRRQWTVEALRVQAPYARVELNRPVRFGYGRRPDVAGAVLKFDVDLLGLSKSGGDAASTFGHLSGSLAFLESGVELPDVQFDVKGTQVGWGRIPAGDFEAQGRLNLQERSLSGARFQGHWAGAALARALPAGLSADSLSLSVQADGAWPALRHQGVLRAEGVRVKPLLPATVALQWNGSGLSVSHFGLEARIASTTVDANGSADLESVRLTALDFAPGGTPALHLISPTSIVWKGGLRLEPIDLSGGGAGIMLTPRQDSLALQVTRVPAAWVSAVIPWTGPNFVAQSLAFDGHWEQGRLVFAVRTAVDLWLSDGLARVTVDASGNGRRVRIREGRVESGGALVASIAGELPVWWQREAPHLQFSVSEPLRLRADTGADSPFWAALADSFGLRLQSPHASLSASGSLERPIGDFHLQIGTLAAAPAHAEGKVPDLRNLRLDLHANRQDVVLDRLTGSIAGRSVSGTGRMPMTAAEWADLFAHGGARPWSQAQATLAIADAGMASLLPYLPSVFAPAGHWSARFRYTGGSLEGAVHLHGLQLKPIAPLGLVQNISGDLIFHGRAVDVPGLTAEIGGQTARITGRIDLPPKGAPQFVLSVQGSALPLVRQTNLLVRADLDLKASTVDEQTRVTGTVKIVDGLMLGDLEDLLPSGVIGGGRPPPYFAVTQAPFSHWHAQVDLVADHTLRIHTTLFTGDASARFQILGPLGDPRAVGQMTIDEGNILLPFANFDVQVGAVRLEPDDPYHPRIDVIATARHYDYDLRMNATGDADSPILTFSSNPALPSDQILQLVMAGQMPQTGSLLQGNQAQVAGLGEYLGQGLLSGLSGGSGANARLSVQSGQELSITGRPTYEIEYRLGKRWWITGEYDVFDDYNAGLKWRVYTKGGRP